MCGPATTAIVGPTPASTRIRHRLDAQQLVALEGRKLTDLKPDAPLRSDFRRLLGNRYDRFIAGLGAEEPMRRVGDAVLGEGVRPGSTGYDASLFVLGPRGAMFAVLKGGPFGADIETFGANTVLASWPVRHRYLEFTDLDE